MSEIEIRGYEQGKREGIQRALEIIKEKVKEIIKWGNITNWNEYWRGAKEQIKELTQKLNQEMGK